MLSRESESLKNQKEKKESAEKELPKGLFLPPQTFYSSLACRLTTDIDLNRRVGEENCTHPLQDPKPDLLPASQSGVRTSRCLYIHLKVLGFKIFRRGDRSAGKSSSMKRENDKRLRFPWKNISIQPQDETKRKKNLVRQKKSGRTEKKWKKRGRDMRLKRRER